MEPTSNAESSTAPAEDSNTESDTAPSDLFNTCILHCPNSSELAHRHRIVENNMMNNRMNNRVNQR